MLKNAMLTPESEIKIETGTAKGSIHSFGSFETLGIYKEYDDSALSSIQLDEENGTPDHGGYQGASKDDVSIISTVNATSAPSNAASQSPIHTPNFAQFAIHQQISASKMNAAGQLNSHALPSPLQQQLLADPPRLDTPPDKESRKRKRYVPLEFFAARY